MNAITSFFLMFLAYTPLWLLVAIRDVNSIVTGDRQNLVAEWTGLGVITVFWVIGYIWVCLVSRRDFVSWAEPFDLCKIVSCKEQKTVTVGFVVKNVMPMFVFNPTTAEGLALTLSYFLVIASISVRHRHFPPNVVVEWLGWTFYECTLESIKGSASRTETVLSREYLGGANQSRKLMKLNNETFVAITREEGK
ncbi:MAG: hypothetical protein E7049_03535 [Lentisphaerae bacterium]|nr:hypothetical protein [Lentisphaerota bacterium]